MTKGKKFMKENTPERDKGKSTRLLEEKNISSKKLLRASFFFSLSFSLFFSSSFSSIFSSIFSSPSSSSSSSSSSFETSDLPVISLTLNTFIFSSNHPPFSLSLSLSLHLSRFITASPCVALEKVMFPSGKAIYLRV